MPHAEYKPVRELHGGRSKVLLAERKDRLYALKFVNLTSLPQVAVNAAVEELKLLRALNHPNVVRLRECEMIRKNGMDFMMIVTDYAQGGSLADRVQAMLGAPFVSRDWLLAASRWTAQVTAALAFLHEKNIIHRDLKLDNVLVSAAGDALLADFGFARELSESGHASTVLGTPMNMAPELWVAGAVYGCGTDLWALGCVVIELVSLKHPFERARDPKTLHSLVVIAANTVSDRLNVCEINLDELIPPDARELATNLMQVATLLLSQKPERRPTCAQLLTSQPLVNFIETE